MTDVDRNQKAARFIYEDHQARRAYTPIPDNIAPRTIGEAYEMQEVFHELITGDLGEISGYKIALTTPQMQKLVGFGEPCAGAVMANNIHRSPATVTGAEYGHLGAECEVAVLLNSDLPADGAPYTRTVVAEAVAALMPAFELVDDRGADYSNLIFLNVVVDNTWNAGVVLGPEVTDWRDIDLVSARGSMSINGQQVGKGRGGDVMGHPLEALAWLANTLAARGKSLSKGMIVMTGSIVTTKFLNPGDTAVVSIDGLGEATVTVG